MKMTWKSGRLRRRSPLDNVWYVAGSCIAFFLLGNLVMLQTYHGLVDNRDQSLHGDSLQGHEISINGLSNSFFGKPSLVRQQFDQYSVFESRLRKLMEDTHDTGQSDIITDHLSSQVVRYDRNGKRLLNCDDIDNITDKEYIASGWTKAVYKGLYNGEPVAIKTVDIRGQDVGSCVEAGGSIEDCYWRAAQKIVKEIVILQGIPHDNIIKVIGFCVPQKDSEKDGGRTVVMVTELGETIDLIKLLQMSWEERLRISYDVTVLMHHLSGTPYGPVSMNDYRRQQFVLVNGQLKLSDVDDVGFDEPTCSQDNDCLVVFSSANFTKKLSCIDGYCSGYNEHRNLFNAGRHFTTFLLPHGAPKTLKLPIEEIVSAYNSLSLNSKDLVKKMTQVVNLYKSGEYLNRSSTEQHKSVYIKYSSRDLPGEYDYRCRYSMSGGGCTVSVFDGKEAENLCSRDPDCKSFVMTNSLTWTGRKIVHLKNGVGTLSLNKKTDIFIKPS